MDVTAWLHCNIGCGKFRKLNPNIRFAFASCGHVLCEYCAKKVVGNCCPVPMCKKKMKMILINNQTPQEVKTLLMELTEILSHQEKQVKQLLVEQQQQLIEKQEQQLRYFLEQCNEMINQHEQQVMQLLQQQKQRLTQVASFQKQQMKSYVDTTIRMIQRKARQEKENEIELLKTEWTQQSIAARSRDRDNSPRHSGASNSHHLFQPISGDGYESNPFKSPLPVGQFNRQQPQQRSAFAQNTNSFGGIQGQEQVSVEFSQGGRRISLQKPSPVENHIGAGPGIRLNLGSLSSQAKSRGVLSSSTAVGQSASHFQQSRHRHPVPLNSGRTSLEHFSSAFQSPSPASEVGSSIASPIPTTPVNSGPYGRNNNHFYHCKK